jgi:CRISPR-associated endonuclease Csn1
VTRFEINQPDFRPVWERQKLGGKLVMRLHKGDPIIVNIDGKDRVFVVNSIRASKPDIITSEHFEGGSFDDRKKAGENPELILSMSKLQRLATRPVHIDILGQTIRRKSNVD